jgi:large subunit ribosomal protein L11
MTIPAVIEGGKASAAPPLGPAIGPSGANIGQIIAAINEKTKDFAGMSVPIKVTIDKTTKEFSIEVGTPPVSSLVKKELGLTAPVKEEAGVKGKKSIGNLTMVQVAKIVRMKRDAILGKSFKSAAKEVIGTCLTLGASVEGKDPREVQKEIDAGKFDSVLKE